MELITLPHSLLSNDLFFPYTISERRRASSVACNNDIVDSESELRVSMDLPGLKPSDLNITVDNGMLRVTGARRFVSSDGSTIKKTRIDKSFSLDMQTIDVDRVKANLSDGVLTVTAPKHAKPKPRTITITTGTDDSLAIDKDKSTEIVTVETVTEEEGKEASEKTGSEKQ